MQILQIMHSEFNQYLIVAWPSLTVYLKIKISPDSQEQIVSIFNLGIKTSFLEVRITDIWHLGNPRIRSQLKNPIKLFQKLHKTLIPKSKTVTRLQEEKIPKTQTWACQDNYRPVFEH